jgi:hypothetical protein
LKELPNRTVGAIMFADKSTLTLFHVLDLPVIRRAVMALLMLYQY